MMEEHGHLVQRCGSFLLIIVSEQQGKTIIRLPHLGSIYSEVLGFATVLWIKKIYIYNVQ